jgi:hypothetical protein
LIIRRTSLFAETGQGVKTEAYEEFRAKIEQTFGAYGVSKPFQGGSGLPLLRRFSDASL